MGFQLNESIAHADAVKSFDYTSLDNAVQYDWVIEPAMDDAYQLVAAQSGRDAANLVTAVYARLLAARQDSDGSWTSFHQRPPSSYSFFTETALTLRAIQLYSRPSEKANAARAYRTRPRNGSIAYAPDTEAPHLSTAGTLVGRRGSRRDSQACQGAAGGAAIRWRLEFDPWTRQRRLFDE